MPSLRLPGPAFCLTLACLFQGCASIPLGTIAKLWSFDIDTADPAVLRAAVRLPAYLAPRPGGVVLKVLTWADGERERHEQAFVLEESFEGAELAPLSTYRRKGDELHVYRVSATDVTVLRRLLADHREKKRTGKAKENGTIAVGAEACRRAPLPSGPIPTSTYLKLDEQDGYLPLLIDLDLRNQLGESELSKNIPPCAAS